MLEGVFQAVWIFPKESFGNELHSSNIKTICWYFSATKQCRSSPFHSSWWNFTERVDVGGSAVEEVVCRETALKKKNAGKHKRLLEIRVEEQIQIQTEIGQRMYERRAFYLTLNISVSYWPHIRTFGLFKDHSDRVCDQLWVSGCWTFEGGADPFCLDQPALVNLTINRARIF